MDENDLSVIEPTSLERHRLAVWPPGTREPSRLAVHEDGRVACTIAVGRSSVKLSENVTEVSSR